MNNYLKIIPTPKFCSYTSGKPFSFKKICVVEEISDVLKNALGILSKEHEITYTDEKTQIWLSIQISVSFLKESLMIAN